MTVRSAVSILEELALAFFQHADDLVGNAIHQDGFADAVVRGKEVLVDFVADDGDVFAVLVFELGEEAALRDVRVVHVLIGGVGTGVIQIGDLVLAVARHAAAAAAAVED